MLHHWLQPPTSLPQETQVIVHVHIIWNLSTLQVENGHGSYLPYVSTILRTQDWLCRSTENVWALPSHAAKNRMLGKLPAESRFLYAKHSSSALTNCDKPMQNLDQSKQNRWRVPWSQRQHLHQKRPHATEMWKFGGTTSPMCQTRGLNSSVKLPAFQCETIWLHFFVHAWFSLLLSSLHCARNAWRCDILEIQNKFSLTRFAPGFVHWACGKSWSGQKCSLAPPPLVSLNVIRVICHLSAWSI